MMKCSLLVRETTRAVNHSLLLLHWGCCGATAISTCHVLLTVYYELGEPRFLLFGEEHRKITADMLEPWLVWNMGFCDAAEQTEYTDKNQSKMGSSASHLIFQHILAFLCKHCAKTVKKPKHRACFVEHEVPENFKGSIFYFIINVKLKHKDILWIESILFCMEFMSIVIYCSGQTKKKEHSRRSPKEGPKPGREQEHSPSQ